MAASPSGRIAVVAAANRDDGSSALHIGRATNEGWQWLGAPLISSKEPFTHAQRASIAFVGERPVVAWSEELHARLSGLFVSAWNGSSWARLGRLSPRADDTFLTPAIAVDSKQRIWLAWSDDTEMRVVRWSGSTWIDVGRDSLKAISSSHGETSTREISLAVGNDGVVWVLSLASKFRSGASVFLARWDGMSWRAIPAPPGPAGKDSTAAAAKGRTPKRVRW
jgi:hypothetical protein